MASILTQLSTLSAAISDTLTKLASLNAALTQLQSFLAGS